MNVREEEAEEARRDFVVEKEWRTKRRLAVATGRHSCFGK